MHLSKPQAVDDDSTFSAHVGGGLQLVIAADRLAGGRAASSLVTGGILAFYTVVVLAIGRAARSLLGSSRYRLLVDELPVYPRLVEPQSTK